LKIIIDQGKGNTLSIMNSYSCYTSDVMHTNIYNHKGDTEMFFMGIKNTK